MTTLLEEKTTQPAKTTDPKTADRREEIDELLRIKKAHKFDGNRVPCPCCAVVVETNLNRCPFCESDIAAETALARETTRRLRELSGELDAENARRVRAEEAPKTRGFFARLKYLFEGDRAEEAPKIDSFAPRLLGNLAPGDAFKVLEEDGAWVKVKTQSGEVGWVYSTVRKRS